MKVKNSPGNFPRTGERRHFSRQKVNSLVYLNVKPDNGGILLDLSEGGMCVSVANPLPVSSRVEFSLGLGGNEMVEGTGLVSWLSQSGRSAGVCFVRLPEGSRRRVHEWLDGANVTAEQNETRPVLVWPPASREKESSPGPRLEAVAPAVPPDMPEPQAPAEDPVVAATRELHPPPSHPIFARQPRPPAMPEEPEAEPETPHLNLKMPSLFMPQKREEENDSPSEADKPGEVHFSGGLGRGRDDDQGDVHVFRLAVASSSESRKREEREGLQVKRFLVVAFICASLLALGLGAFLVYTGTIPIFDVFGAASAARPIARPVKVKELAPRRNDLRHRRTEISTRDERGGRPVRDVSTFYGPRSNVTSFPVEVTNPSNQHWLATVVSRRVVRGEASDGASNAGSAFSIGETGPGSGEAGSETQSPAVRLSHPAGASGMRTDGALVEEGTLASPRSSVNVQEPTPKPVVVEAVIGKDGGVKNVRLVSSPVSQLAQAVLEAVRQWHYRPFYRNGQPVQFTTRITFDFSRSQRKP